jgi:hypothetical protein
VNLEKGQDPLARVFRRGVIVTGSEDLSHHHKEPLILMVVQKRVAGFRIFRHMVRNASCSEGALQSF